MKASIAFAMSSALAPLLLALDLAATNKLEPPPSAEPRFHPPPSAVQPTARTDDGFPTSLIRRLHQQAIEAGDREVADAIEYNQRHLGILATNDAIAAEALQQLANTGDAFTLRWLEASRRRHLPQPRQTRMADAEQRIRERLQQGEMPAEGQVADWLLRAAVSDLTCNTLEVEIGRFRQSWFANHLHLDAVQREVKSFAAGQPETESALDIASVRARARRYCLRMLQQPALPPAAPSAADELP